MVSNSSKALPFISIGVGVAMAVLAILGYGEQLDQVVALLGVILPITAGGGLINKAIEGSVEKKKQILEEGSLEALIKKVIEESKK
jgi:hypothetical protein